MLASGVYNRYVNTIDNYNEEEEVSVVPGAPKKVMKTRKFYPSMQPRKLEFVQECPPAPMKAKKQVEVDADVHCHSHRLQYGECPGAPKKVKKTRELHNRENVMGTRINFTSALVDKNRVYVNERVCPGAPRKLKRALSRTPLAWTAFTEADCQWNLNA